MPHPVTKHVRSEEWKPATVIEMKKKLLGFIFVTGIVRKTKLDLYWSTKLIFQTPVFPQKCLGTDLSLTKGTFTSMTIMRQKQTKIICKKFVQF